MGAEHSDAFKGGYWDGLEHLLKYSKVKMCHTIPTGLVEDVVNFLDSMGLEYSTTNKIETPPPVLDFNWGDGGVLRPYQEETHNVATSPFGKVGLVARGLIIIAIRGGKTRTTAAIINTLAVETLFFVQSRQLLRQTVKALSDALGVAVGQIGDGKWDERPVTVATVQSVVSKSRAKQRKALMKRKKLLVFDECHHLEGEEWRSVLTESEAPYKLGLTATDDLAADGEAERSTIWLKAATGPVLIRVTPSELIRLGYLARPTIRLHKIKTPRGISPRRKWSKKLHDKCIVNNIDRNTIIVDEVEWMVKNGIPPLISTTLLPHTGELARMCAKRGLYPATVTGAGSNRERDRLYGEFEAGRRDVLVGTVFGEGVDIPHLAGVVNAAGGKDRKMTMQRLRNLTMVEGKNKAVVVDFVDLMHPKFAEHSRERLATYRGEPEFKIEIVK